MSLDRRETKRRQKRRVLILTLPPRGNYGGILQAWALQTVLSDFGLTVDTNVAMSGGQQGSLFRMLLPALRWLNSRGLRGPHRKKETETLTAAEISIDRDLIKFVSRRMRTVKLFGSGTEPIPALLSRYTHLVTGSDQVWRPAFGHVPTFLFDFALEHDHIKRLSYAASFGLGDSREYSEDLKTTTKELAAKFDGISVREASGVQLVSALWDRQDATQHLDPALLPSRSAYEQLIKTAAWRSRARVPAGGVVTYILNPDGAKQLVVSHCAERLRLPTSTLLPPRPSTFSEYREAPELFIKPPVESWLANIKNAGLLVTDSFHGCVFAILFHIPFVAVPNEARGAERFFSLFELFGLQDRVFDKSAPDHNAEVDRLLASSIDWDRVDMILAEERRRARGYLESHLGVHHPSLTGGLTKAANP